MGNQSAYEARGKNPKTGQQLHQEKSRERAWCRSRQPERRLCSGGTLQMGSKGGSVAGTARQADWPLARGRSHAARGGSRARSHRAEEREGLLGSVYRGRLAILPLDRGLLQEAAVTQPASPYCLSLQYFIPPKAVCLLCETQWWTGQTSTGLQ